MIDIIQQTKDIYACPNCGKTIEQLEVEECPYCSYNFVEGGVIDTSTGENVNYGTIRVAYEKVKNSELVKSIKDDIQNSKSIELVKNYFKNIPEKHKQKKLEKEAKKAEIEALQNQIKDLKRKK